MLYVDNVFTSKQITKQGELYKDTHLMFINYIKLLIGLSIKTMCHYFKKGIPFHLIKVIQRMYVVNLENKVSEKCVQQEELYKAAVCPLFNLNCIRMMHSINGN
jgi:hypothetical protein